jgi:urocanate hydratase
VRFSKVPFQTACAEVNAKITTRHSQGWINEVIEDIDELKE